MRGQCGAIFQIGQIIYVDDGDGGLAVFGDRDRTVRVLGSRNQLSKVGARFSQAIRIRRTAKCALCRECLSWPPLLPVIGSARPAALPARGRIRRRIAYRFFVRSGVGGRAVLSA